MNILHEIFGQGSDLTSLQMGCRGIAVFFIALILLRISGRRSFGLRTPLDNIIIIILGAVLSRGIVGASSFLPVIVTCTVIVVMHRFLGWLTSHNKPISKIIEGNKILLFRNGAFIGKNLGRALVCEEDVMQGLRETALTENLDKIDSIYIERNGEISAVKKEL